jgi:hypothetical protein
MRPTRRGTALIAVTLIGVLILSLGVTLVGVTASTNRTSYGLNRQLVCRYAAEGVLQEAMFRVKQEEAANTPGWFDQARGQSDPVLIQRVPRNSSSADSPMVRLSIYDPAEALEKFQTVLGGSEYLLEAQSILDGFVTVLHLRLSYYVEAGSAEGASTDGSSGSDLFTKYLLWTRSGTSSSNDLFTYGSTSDGHVHFQGDVVIGDKSARFGMPVRASGSFGYLQPPYVSSAWTQAEKDSLFDYDRDGSVGTAARVGFESTSEADSKNNSGGMKSSIEQPPMAQTEAALLDAVKAQTAADSTLAALWIEKDNPYYATFGEISYASIEFYYSSKTTKVRVKAFLANGTAKTTTVTLPGSDGPYVIYTNARINYLGGVYSKQITVATTYERGDVKVRQYGIYNDSPYYLPMMDAQGVPAINITDHLIAVDQYGRPKYWMFGDSNSPLSSDPSSGGGSGSGESPEPGVPSGNSESFAPVPRGLSMAAGSRLTRLAAWLQDAPGDPSKERMHPIPKRLSPTGADGMPGYGIQGVPVDDTTGSNIDSSTAGWGTGWKLKRNAASVSTAALGIYSRGDTKITSRAYKGLYDSSLSNMIYLKNDLGMYAFYGGGANSRYYMSPNTPAVNRAFAGSVVSPRPPLMTYKVHNDKGEPLFRAGIIGSKVALYDWGLASSPPPFWPKYVASTSARLVVKLGSIYEVNAR